MSLTIIVAVAKNGCIGKNNEIPWYIPDDLKHFKKLTLGHVVVMGRKTYESIVARLGKPLPDRTSVIITQQTDYPAPEGVFVYTSVYKALEDFKDQELICIGGGMLYHELLPYADKLYITEVHQTVAGDTFFPLYNKSEWKEIEREDRAGFSFVTRIKNPPFTTGGKPLAH